MSNSTYMSALFSDIDMSLFDKIKSWKEKCESVMDVFSVLDEEETIEFEDEFSWMVEIPERLARVSSTRFM